MLLRWGSGYGFYTWSAAVLIHLGNPLKSSPEKDRFHIFTVFQYSPMLPRSNNQTDSTSFKLKVLIAVLASYCGDEVLDGLRNFAVQMDPQDTDITGGSTVSNCSRVECQYETDSTLTAELPLSEVVWHAGTTQTVQRFFLTASTVQLFLLPLDQASTLCEQQLSEPALASSIHFGWSSHIVKSRPFEIYSVPLLSTQACDVHSARKSKRYPRTA